MIHFATFHFPKPSQTSNGLRGPCRGLPMGTIAKLQSALRLSGPENLEMTQNLPRPPRLRGLSMGAVINEVAKWCIFRTPKLLNCSPANAPSSLPGFQDQRLWPDYVDGQYLPTRQPQSVISLNFKLQTQKLNCRPTCVNPEAAAPNPEANASEGLGVPQLEQFSVSQ